MSGRKQIDNKMPASKGQKIGAETPSLPPRKTPSEMSPDIHETVSQIRRLANGLNSQLLSPGKESTFAKELQLQTRLLGGVSASISVEVEAKGAKHSSAEQIGLAAAALKSFNDSK